MVKFIPSYDTQVSRLEDEIQKLREALAKSEAEKKALIQQCLSCTHCRKKTCAGQPREVKGSHQPSQSATTSFLKPTKASSARSSRSIQPGPSTLTPAAPSTTVTINGEKYSYVCGTLHQSYDLNWGRPRCMESTMASQSRFNYAGLDCCIEERQKRLTAKEAKSPASPASPGTLVDDWWYMPTPLGNEVPTTWYCVTSHEPPIPKSEFEKLADLTGLDGDLPTHLEPLRCLGPNDPVLTQQLVTKGKELAAESMYHYCVKHQPEVVAKNFPLGPSFIRLGFSEMKYNLFGWNLDDRTRRAIWDLVGVRNSWGHPEPLSLGRADELLERTQRVAVCLGDEPRGLEIRKLRDQLYNSAETTLKNIEDALGLVVLPSDPPADDKKTPPEPGTTNERVERRIWTPHEERFLKELVNSKRDTTMGLSPEVVSVVEDWERNWYTWTPGARIFGIEHREVDC
ncbi:hypothetical protein QBC35DRAFT_476595 [Podospora australis]|uniref:Uncharacterized protein n=1 Tax=Podospora australis TaxID=1536484 RepID=A0AAN6WP36_9PEZI|nr:hypothetical protein QBC35DRAFT_476595 [Podospora australis]